MSSEDEATRNLAQEARKFWQMTGEVPGLVLDEWVQKGHPGVRDVGFKALCRSFKEADFLPADRPLSARLIIEIDAAFPEEEALADFCARAPWRRAEAIFARLELLVALQSSWRGAVASVLRGVQARHPEALEALVPVERAIGDDAEILEDFFDPGVVRLLETEGLAREAERYTEAVWRSTGEVRRAFERFRHPDEAPPVPARPGCDWQLDSDHQVKSPSSGPVSNTPSANFTMF